MYVKPGGFNYTEFEQRAFKVEHILNTGNVMENRILVHSNGHNVMFG